MATRMQQHAEMHMLSQLTTNVKYENDGYVRLTGRIVILDKGVNVCCIEHSGFALWIDLSLVDYSNLEIDRFCQVIGKLRTINPTKSFPGNDELQGVSVHPFYMNASIMRVVDGLDMELFYKALQIRQEFLISQQSGSS